MNDVKRLEDVFMYDCSTGNILWKKPYRGKAVAGSVTKGFKSKTPYIFVTYKGRKYSAHRLAWMLFYGDYPDGNIDHIDGNGCNNKIENLRCISPSDNHKNKPMQSNNTSGHVGVRLIKATGKWCAEITSKRKKIFLGNYSDINDAIDVRKKAEKEYGFHKNHGRVSGSVG